MRDASEPRKTLSLSDRAEALEGLEQRLKQDILQESLKYANLSHIMSSKNLTLARRYGGLILTHNEVASKRYDFAAPDNLSDINKWILQTIQPVKVLFCLLGRLSTQPTLRHQGNYGKQCGKMDGVWM